MNRNRQPPMVAVATITPTLPLPHLSTQLPKIFYNLALLTGGSFLWVLALQIFMLPNHILSGGLLGIAMICGYFFPSVDVAWLNLLLNLPLFWLGWCYVGVGFLLYSLFGTLIFSLLAGVAIIPVGVDIHPLLACLGAGVLGGGGSALILSSAGTAGGLDILIVYLRNRFRWRIGRLMLALNGATLLAGGGLLGLETLIYSLLFLTVCSYTVGALVSRPAV
jgi:uncharacterized membrane-anchored protein YitT (DUF2179 family)